ncbi:MAG: hypothetical protein QXO71_05185, partial [Candidatus Jordarchaeaceae archaeon]
TLSVKENEIFMNCEPDAQITVLFAKSAVKEMEKIYGPLFTRMVAEYALEFEAKKLKEEPPPKIQGLDQVTNYIIANLDRYPRGYCALFYGIAKTEKNLEGSLGSGSRRAVYNAMKAIIESSGVFNSIIGSTEDLFEAAAKASELMKANNIGISVRWIRSENALVMVVPDCPYKDACREYVNEGISRMVGGLECTTLNSQSVISEVITKKRFDFKLDEFDKPECRGRVFEV